MGQIIEVQPGQDVRLPAEQELKTLDAGETAMLYSGKSFDTKQYKPDRNLFVVAGQSFVDSIAGQLIDTPATFSAFVGKSSEEKFGYLSEKQISEMEKGADIKLFGLLPIGKMPPVQFSEEDKAMYANLKSKEPSWETKVGEKMRNFGLALRAKLALTSENLTPNNFGEQVAAAIGSGLGFMGGMTVASGIGAAVGGTQGGAPGAAIGAPVAAGAYAFAQMKASAMKELMDVGYSTEAINDLSNYYAGASSALSFTQFTLLQKLAFPVAVQAVKTTVGRSVVRATLSTTGKTVLKSVEGGLEAGALAIAQTRLTTEFDIATGIKNRDFQADLQNDVASFIGFYFIGGVSGAAGQLTMRRTHIQKLSEKFPDIPKNEIAKLYDESVLRANDMYFDSLIQHTDIEPQMRGIQNAFAKIEGRSEVGIPEALPEPANAQEFAAIANLINPEKILINAKTKELQTTIQKLLREKAQVNQQIIDTTVTKTQTEQVALQKKVLDLENRLDKAQADYQASLAGNPRLQALEEKLRIAQEELAAADPNFEKTITSDKDLVDVGSIILSEGGIASYPKDQSGKGEYKNVPAHLRNRRGKTLDEMAQYLKDNYPQLQISDVASLEERLQEYAMQKQEGVTPAKASKASPEALQALRDKVTALQTRIQGIQSPEETVKIAEQKVQSYQEAFTKTFEALQAVTDRLEELQKNPESALKADTEELQTKKTQLEKKAERLTEEIMSAEQQAEAFRQGTARVTGKVELNASQVRQAAKQELRGVVAAYKAGVKITEQTFKAMQKSFVVLLRDIKFSNKAKTQLLRKVLTVRTAEQFNAKIGPIVDGINTLIRGEQVADLQKLGKVVLDRMGVDKQNVFPQAQLFSEHLQRVFREDVPLSYDPNSSNPVELAKSMVEQAVYDLKNAGDDIGGATRAYKVIQDFYRDQLQQYSDQKAAAEQTFSRWRTELSQGISGGAKIDVNKESLDNVRQTAQRSGLLSTLNLAPYTLSFLSILDGLDRKSGTKAMQGPLVREFSPENAFQKWIVHTDWSKDRIDGKMREIYGKNSEAIWAEHIGLDFLDVPVLERNAEGVETQRPVNISRAAAMSLFLMTKMPSVRQDLIKMGIDEAWLSEFEQGNNVSFTEQDHKWMASVRETLDAYADRIAPIYERLTNKPFRRVDNYFMIFRYMTQAAEVNGVADSRSIIDSMLDGTFEKMNVADSDRLKSRTGGKQALKIPDIYQAMTSYAADMNHFLGYADYVVKLQKTFQSDEIRRQMEVSLSPTVPAIIKEYIDTLAHGSVSRTSDRVAMRGFMSLLGMYARNQVAAPKSGLRQLSGIAAFTQYEGMGAFELAKAALEIPAAVKSGEIRKLLDTAYMRQRYEGLYEFSVKWAQEIAQAEHFSSLKDNSILGPIRKAISSRKVNDLMTLSARFGDRWASVIGGWAMYKKSLKETGSETAAVGAAIRAIEETQQSMDPGRLPVAFGRNSLPDRLLTTFQRTPSIYLDQYVRFWKDVNAGRIDKAQFVRTMLTYHVWVPLFETAITVASSPLSLRGAITMAAGPMAYHLILGNAVTAITAGLAKYFSDSDEELPQYFSEGSSSTLLASFFRDVKNAGKEVGKFLQEPDWEGLWKTIKGTAQVGDLSKIPTGWLSQGVEGVYNILEGDFESGAKRLLGYSDSAIEAAQ